MILIGEQINCTRKRIARAVTGKDAAYIQTVAVRQVEAGAVSLDVNGGIAGHEAEYLPWLVDVVQAATDVPLCLDSADPEALARALPRCRHRPMINSITNDPARLSALVPLARQHRARVIALCLDESGYPITADDRVAIACSLIDRLSAAGIPLDYIYVDPAVFPISTDTRSGLAVLDTIAAVRAAYPGVHAICGLSNVSFGLPIRALLNQTFLMLAMGRGLDAVIADPCDPQLMANLVAARTLLNQDEDCLAYLQAHHRGHLEPARGLAGAPVS
jgi:5-methyltetrahydrofolate--homocysteine methyltransferase